MRYHCYEKIIRIGHTGSKLESASKPVWAIFSRNKNPELEERNKEKNPKKAHEIIPAIHKYRQAILLQL
jgi:hypothetical protein